MGGGGKEKIRGVFPLKLKERSAANFIGGGGTLLGVGNVQFQKPDFENVLSNVRNIVYSDVVGVPYAYRGVGGGWGRPGDTSFSPCLLFPRNLILYHKL